MGQAAQTVVADDADYAIARKRKGKPLRGTGLYTGNITVFHQLKEVERSKVRRAGSRAHKRTLKVDENVTPNSNPQTSAGGAPVTAFSRAAKLISSHSGIAAAVLVMLATGAEVSSVWSSNEINEPVQFIVDVTPLPDPVATKSPIPDTTTSKPEIDPAVEELRASRKLANDYKQKIQQMQVLNESLQTQKDALDKETIDLNKELLQLEWEVAALEATPKKTAGARTVYNIVNVPVGDGANQSGYNPNSLNYDERDMEQYDNYQLTQTASYVTDDFEPSEDYYDPMEPALDDSYEEFGRPYFN